MRIEYNDDGFYQLRRHPRVVAELERIGKRTMAHANATLDEGEGYSMDSAQGGKRPQGRWRVTVYTDSPHAMRSNAKHNTLLRVLHD